MRSPQEFSVWQSVSDLAMGLMAVVLLLLILLLVQQGKEKADAEQERKQAEEDRAKVETERAVFAAQVLSLLLESDRLVRHQDKAEALVRNVFERPECPLKMDDQQDRLLTDNGAPADLYPRGRHELSEDGRRNIEACAVSFECLGRFLKPGDSLTDTLARCTTGDATASEEAIQELRNGLDSLVVQGNTDRQRYVRDVVPEISNPLTGARVLIDDESESYVANHFLGAERARQAVGNLLDTLRAVPDLFPTLRERLRVESASFGRYGEFGCAPDAIECHEARNLSLRVQWRKESLREPFTEFKKNLCERLYDPESALYKGLVDPTKRADIVTELRGDRDLSKCPALDLSAPIVDPKKIADCLGCRTVIQTQPEAERP